MPEITQQIDAFFLAQKYGRYPIPQATFDQWAPQYLQQFPDDTADDHFQILYTPCKNCPFQYGGSSDLALTVLTHLEGTVRLDQIAANQSVYWLIRRKALEMIREHSNPDTNWERIVQMVADPTDSDEIRRSALVTIDAHDRRELLPKLQAIFHNPSNAQKWKAAPYWLSNTLAKFGDETQYVRLLENLDFERNSRGIVGRPADEILQSIENQMGAEAFGKIIAREIGFHEPSNINFSELAKSQNPHVRRWAISKTPGQTRPQLATVIAALDDPVWEVRQQAASNLIRWSNDSLDEILLEQVKNSRQSRLARSWTTFTLLQRGADIKELLESQIPDEVWAVPWDFKTSLKLRRHILAWSESSGPGSDIRYDIESELYPTKMDSDEQAAEDRDRLLERLAQQGINVTNVCSAGEYHEQGWGSYWVLRLGTDDFASELFVSTFWKIVMYVRVSRHSHEDGTGGFSQWFPGEKRESPPDEQYWAEQESVRRVAEDLDFYWLDEPLANQIVPSLNISYFSNCKPQPIRVLFFLWES